VRRFACPALAVLALALPASAAAQEGVPAACPGDPITPTQVITGQFGADVLHSYVMVPFSVPAGTTAVRVKYCYDQPAQGTQKHTLDLGLWAPGNEFRGWGGSSHPDVTVSPEGFSSEAQYRARPKGHVPGKTTRGFIPGPIPAGTWHAELGVAAIIGREAGDADGVVAWRLEIELSSDPAFADEPYRPARYDTTPARRRAGWYEGDLHVHAEHSALGDATIRETADYAFKRAGLDFVTFSDYVTSAGWGELGRHQARYPGRLLARSSEVITYFGHTNNHVSARYVDHRTGPVLEWLGNGWRTLRGPRSPFRIFREVRAAGGFTQVNHPTIFPSSNEAFRSLCRGCPWDYGAGATDWSQVDALEVHTGPPTPGGSPNAFTTTAIDLYDRLWNAGHRIAAVAVSDSHHAGEPENPVTQSPVGTGRTVVFARRLSERGIRDAVRADRTYAKVLGPGSSDLRLELRDGRRRAIIGGTLRARRAELRARVFGAPRNAPARTLEVRRNGRVVRRVRVRGRDFRYRMTVRQPGHWRIQVMRGEVVDALTSPITLRRGRAKGSTATRR